jgi:hypothetical protein
MGQIVGWAAKPKRCNINQLSQLRTPAAGEYILVSSDNSMNAAGQGNFDCYIEGDGQKAATALKLHYLVESTPTEESKSAVSSGGVYDAFMGDEKSNTYTKADAPNANTILKYNGTTNTFSGYYTTNAISVNGAFSIEATGAYVGGSTYSGFILYDGSDTPLYHNTAAAFVIDLSEYPTASYLRFSTNNNNTSIAVKFKNLLASATQQEVTDSQKPVSGKAVKGALEKYDMVLYGYDETFVASDGIANTILQTTGATSSRSGYYTSDFIGVVEGAKIVADSLVQNAATYSGLVLYDSTQTKIDTPTGVITSLDFADYPSAKYFKFCSQSANGYVRMTAGENLVGKTGNIDFDALAGVIQISEDEHVYGSETSVGSNTSLYNYYTINNSACLSDGFLKEVNIKVSDSGVYTFYVGLLDQNNALVNERAFELQLEAGINRIDVMSQHIGISIGERLFIKMGANQRMTYSFLSDASKLETSALCGTTTTDFALRNTTYAGGLHIYFNWRVVSVNSAFALSSDVERNADAIASLQIQASQIGIVYDNTGTPYTMSVVNGNVVAKSMKFKNVLVLGNSLTACPATYRWWTAGAPMACTRREVGWTALFQRILRQKEPTAVVNGIFMRQWEYNLSTSASSMQAFTDYINQNDPTEIDCIIFRLSENAHPSTPEQFTNAIVEMLRYVGNACPNATIIMTTGMWIKDNYKDTAIAAAASQLHAPLIYPAISRDLQFLGAYVIGDDEQYHQIDDGSVAGHVNDVGFMKFANTLANSLGYVALDELHNVTVLDANNLGYTCLKQGVYNGVFSIKAENATSVTAVDANSNTLVVTARDNGVYTFDFPNADVTITIA